MKSAGAVSTADLPRVCAAHTAGSSWQLSWHFLLMSLLFCFLCIFYYLFMHLSISRTLPFHLLFPNCAAQRRAGALCPSSWGSALLPASARSASPPSLTCRLSCEHQHLLAVPLCLSCWLMSRAPHTPLPGAAQHIQRAPTPPCWHLLQSGPE